MEGATFAFRGCRVDLRPAGLLGRMRGAPASSEGKTILQSVSGSVTSGEIL